MDSLTSLTSFVRTAETLSFVQAARLLGISASAVGKNVARLEHKLGVRLFNRSTRNVSLTAEGAAFLTRCQSILEQIQEAESELTSSLSQPTGKLRISLPVIGYRLLLPALTSGIGGTQVHFFPLPRDGADPALGTARYATDGRFQGRCRDDGQ